MQNQFLQNIFHPLGWDYLKHLTSSIHNSRSSESKKVANISLYQLSNFRFTSLKLSSFNYSSSSSDKYFIIPSRISLAIFSSRSFIPLAFLNPDEKEHRSQKPYLLHYHLQGELHILQYVLFHPMPALTFCEWILCSQYLYF